MPIVSHLDSTDISERIKWISQAISSDYKGEKVTVIPVLTGAFVFASDLIRKLDIKDLQVDFYMASSYHDETYSTGKVEVFRRPKHALAGRHVILIEDIVDTGYTIDSILNDDVFAECESVKVCSLLHKPSRSKVEVPIHYLGFTVDDKFYVGYGMDHAGKYRELPYVGYIEP